MNRKTLLAFAAVAIGTLVLTFLQHMRSNRLQREVSALYSKLTAASYDPGLGTPSARMEASIQNLEYRLQRLESASTEFSGVIDVSENDPDPEVQREAHRVLEREPARPVPLPGLQLL
ncbi:MAG: hypothetical protein KJ072_18400 [Verrucomicrobia bacterium]|nr:hypothetical protein [Verrucomicrobiota bacterium]